MDRELGRERERWMLMVVVSLTFFCWATFFESAGSFGRWLGRQGMTMGEH